MSERDIRLERPPWAKLFPCKFCGAEIFMGQRMMGKVRGRRMWCNPDGSLHYLTCTVKMERLAAPMPRGLVGNKGQAGAGTALARCVECLREHWVRPYELTKAVNPVRCLECGGHLELVSKRRIAEEKAKKDAALTLAPIVGQAASTRKATVRRGSRKQYAKGHQP